MAMLKNYFELFSFYSIILHLSWIEYLFIANITCSVAFKIQLQQESQKQNQYLTRVLHIYLSIQIRIRPVHLSPFTNNNLI